MPRLFLVSLLVATLPVCHHAADFPAAIQSALGTAQEGTPAVPGAHQPWRFLVRELRHLAAGDLAQIPDLTQVNTEGTDPLAAIQDYASALKNLGVDLWVVPVPPKAAIYPEHLAEGITIADVPPMKAFLNKIAATGARVIDLDELFRQHRAAHPDQALYCATDSHWSPLGAQLAAAHIAAALKDHPTISAAAKTQFTRKDPTPLAFHGDLLTAAEKASLPPESLPIARIEPSTAGSSPLLVIGDSHCQVFRTGGSMLASGGGFIDHLAHDLSLPIEEISSQASGSDQPRVDIARRTVKEPAFWESRKVVVWLFTARELTQARWRVIPAKVEPR